MSTTVICPRCGFANPIGPLFCSRCAGRLVPLGQVQSTTGAQSSPAKSWYDWRPTSYSAIQRQGIERTQNGLSLLIIGFLLAPILSPIPNAIYVADTFIVAGAIMVILGRQVFGHRHSRFVVTATKIYVFGLVAAFFNTILFVLSVPGSSLVSALDAFDLFIVGSVVLGAVVGVAFLLLTYVLQGQLGRTLLWAGFSSSIAIQILIFYMVEGELARGVSDFPYIQNQIQLLSLLGLIPAVMNAVAFYLVRAKIQTGELTKNL